MTSLEAQNATLRAELTEARATIRKCSENTADALRERDEARRLLGIARKATEAGVMIVQWTTGIGRSERNGTPSPAGCAARLEEIAEQCRATLAQIAEPAPKETAGRTGFMVPAPQTEGKNA